MNNLSNKVAFCTAKQHTVLKIVFSSTLALFIIFYLYTTLNQHQQLSRFWQSQAKSIANNISQSIHSRTDVTALLFKNFFQQGELSSDAFNKFVLSNLAIFPELQALAWVKNNNINKVNQFEQHKQQQEVLHPGLSKSDSLKFKALTKDLYSLEFMYAKNVDNRFPGLDLLTASDTSRLVNQLLKTGKTVFFNTINRQDNPGAQPLIMAFIPVFSESATGLMPQQTKPALTGYIIAVMQLGKLLESINKDLSTSKSLFYLEDITNPDARFTIFKKKSGDSLNVSNYTSSIVPVSNLLWKINLLSTESNLPKPLTNEPFFLSSLLFLSLGTLFFLNIPVRAERRVEANDSLFFEPDNREERRKNAQRNLQLLAITFESHDAIIITDHNTSILRVNQAFTDITGYSEQEILGKKTRILSSGRQDKQFYHHMWDTLLAENKFSGEFWNRRKNGEEFVTSQTITAVRNNTGAVTHYISMFSDNTAKKAYDNEIQRLAFHDPLTGLPNRRLLYDRIDQELNTIKREQSYGVLLFIDIDNFKTINDSYGHELGDELLIQISKRLSRSARKSDTVSRIGGDEFVVLLSALDGDKNKAIQYAINVSQPILELFSKPFDLSDHHFFITPSIGVTIITNNGDKASDLIKQADTAMFKAKSEGKNSICFFQADMQCLAKHRLMMEKDIRRAIAQQEFSLHYQPQLDSQNKIKSAEALIRWQKPNGDWVSPVDFIPIAEESGLILDIGNWVLMEGCQQLKKWLDYGLELDHLSINVSVKQIRQESFVKQIQNTLETTGLPANKLMLELTESMLIKDIEDTILKLKELKEMGIKLSIDDFGTGYSSLSYLRQLPIDELKIDRSFVNDILNIHGGLITSTIISMAQNLKLTVVAEGVENESQIAFLAGNGCTLFQGYYFSRPLAANQFIDYVENQKT